MTQLILPRRSFLGWTGRWAAALACQPALAVLLGNPPRVAIGQTMTIVNDRPQLLFVNYRERGKSSTRVFQIDAARDFQRGITFTTDGNGHIEIVRGGTQE